MLPARVLRLLLLRLRLPLLLTEARFFSVPLREGVAEADAPWPPKVDAREAERTGKSPSPSTDEPRVRASKVSSNLPSRSLPWR